jgi:hypothetical protein
MSRRSQPDLLRGVLYTLRRKCGKPTCHCATGDLHESPALSFPEGGRTRTITLADTDLEQVRAALARYGEARAKLDMMADAGIAELRSRLAASRARPGR